MGITRQIYCETCHVMADELVAKLNGLDGRGLDWEDEVIIILDHLCGKRNFKKSAADFKFPVDKMVRCWLKFSSFKLSKGDTKSNEHFYFLLCLYFPIKIDLAKPF